MSGFESRWRPAPTRGPHDLLTMGSADIARPATVWSRGGPNTHSHQVTHDPMITPERRSPGLEDVPGAHPEPEELSTTPQTYDQLGMTNETDTTWMVRHVPGVGVTSTDIDDDWHECTHTIRIRKRGGSHRTYHYLRDAQGRERIYDATEWEMLRADGHVMPASETRTQIAAEPQRVAA